ncbi:MAG: PAS domain S-box protein, partial [Elainellaceae cyanobacterium]
MLQILLLEDDQVDYELIQATLKAGGINANLTWLEASQAFAAALSTKPFDLILADYVLPTFDGLEALALAQSICPKVPFILVSGVLGEEKAIDALKQGATDYVLKQRLNRLVPAVKRALQESYESQERQRMAKALRKADDLLRAVVEASPTGIVTLDRARQVMTWNSAAEALYGWPTSAVLAQTLPVIPAFEQERFNRYFDHVLSENQTILDQEYQNLTRDGGLIQVNMSLAPLYDDDEHVYGAVMTATDVTARAQAEAALRRSEATLKQQAEALSSANALLLQTKSDLEYRNRDLKQFAYAISHDLKAPLRGIKNLSAWLEEDLKTMLPAQSKDQLRLLRQRVTRMTLLIDGLLEFVKVGRSNVDPEDVDLNMLLSEVIDSLVPPDGFTIQVQPNLPIIKARRLLLQQVLANLISNAIKHHPRPDGVITISAAKQKEG